jgi:O-antigen ligase/polysaccharide polymerase Wzy-like membrane protein
LRAAPRGKVLGHRGANANIDIPVTARAVADTAPLLSATAHPSGTAWVVSDRLPAAVAYAGVLLLTVLAPFERTAPLIRLPGQSISNLESVLFIVFVAWIVAALASRHLPAVRTALTAPWLGFIGAMALAALAAPVEHVNAFHMTGRFAAGLAIFLLAVNAITSRARLLAAAVALVCAGVIVAVFAILEYFGVPAVLEWLKAFRPHVITVGPLTRAGGSLQYPTIASMYLEVVFAIGVGILLAAIDASRRGWSVALFLALATIAYAISLTLTRGGMISLGAIFLFIGTAHVRARGWDAGARVLVALAVTVTALGAASRSTDMLWLRFTSEGQESWYRAAVEAPSDLALRTGTITGVPVTLTNAGRLAWDSQNEGFFLSYHWAEADSDEYVQFEGLRTTFETPIEPGETVDIRARVRPPSRPGTYRLIWDIVQEHRLWFSGEPDATPTVSRATVEGATGTQATDYVGSFMTVRPGRLVLWKAAARMVRDHPLLGIGPDNFRLTYASYAGLRVSDDRRHSNNMYVEMFAGGGIVGGLAFLWLVWRAAGVSVRARAAASSLGAVALGVAAAVLTIGLHGFVDSFLGFAPTYVLFSLTLGFAAACARGMETRADAHRI